MKRLLLITLVILGMANYLVADMGFAQDTPKSGCEKQACFDKMDTDKNGKISESEFLEYRKKCFTAMDTDKDGFLNKDDFKKCCMKANTGGCLKTNPVKGKECPHMKNMQRQ